MTAIYTALMELQAERPLVAQAQARVSADGQKSRPEGWTQRGTALSGLLHGCALTRRRHLTCKSTTVDARRGRGKQVTFGRLSLPLRNRPWTVRLLERSPGTSMS